MARFQAQTNAVVDDELDDIRERLGLDASQKADLLREVTSIASWVLRQAESGHRVEATRGDEVVPLDHPAVERLRRTHETSALPRLALTDGEARRLATLLDAPFKPTSALRASLTRLASPRRSPPKLRWQRGRA